MHSLDHQSYDWQQEKSSGTNGFQGSEYPDVSREVPEVYSGDSVVVEGWTDAPPIARTLESLTTPSCFLPLALKDNTPRLLGSGAAGVVRGERDRNCAVKLYLHSSCKNNEALAQVPLHYLDRESSSYDPAFRESRSLTFLDSQGFFHAPCLYARQKVLMHFQEQEDVELAVPVIQMSFAGERSFLDLLEHLLPTEHSLLMEYNLTDSLAPRYASTFLETSLREIGLVLARLHQLPPQPQYSRDAFLRDLQRFTEHCIDRSSQLLNSVGLDDARLRGFVRNLFEFTQRSESECPLTFVHNDFWPGNIMISDSLEVVFVDWENAITGIPSLDLANFWYNVGWRYGMDISVFEEAYGLTESGRLLMHGFAAVRTIHFLFDDFQQHPNDFVKLLVPERAIMLDSLLKALENSYSGLVD